MAATAVGCYVKDAGVYKRIEKCHVKDGGVFKECEKIHVKDAGVWKTVWADDIRALGNLSKSIQNFDLFAPCNLGGGFRMQADGQNEFFDTPPDLLFGWHDLSGWLTYDLSRTYQVRFTLSSGDFDVKPVLNTWVTIVTPGTEIRSIQTTQGLDLGIMLLEVRRNEGTPTGVLTSGNVQIELECGLQ